MSLHRLRRRAVAAAGFAGTLTLLALVPAWLSSPAAADAPGEPPLIQEMHAACAAGDAAGMDGAMGLPAPGGLEWMDGHMGGGQHGTADHMMRPHDPAALDGHTGGGHGMMGAMPDSASGREPALW